MEAPNTPFDMKTRTKAFAVRIIKLCSALPRTDVTFIIKNQLLRSGTSVGANYREASKARSDADYSSKVSIALQELEESQYWLELVLDSGLMKAESLSELMDEADQLKAILFTMIQKAKPCKTS